MHAKDYLTISMTEWKGRGQEVRREVQLRAWENPHFQDALVNCQDRLIQRLDDFLYPIIRKLGRINFHAESRANIVKLAIKLWSYIDAAQGKLHLITPSLGSDFDRRTNMLPDYGSTREHESGEVKWVMRRGFTLHENVLEGRSLTIKAHVVTG